MSDWTLRDWRCRVGAFALGPVAFDLPAGHALAVLGVSGAGKTTLLRSLAGVLPSAGGSLRHGERELGAVEPEARGTVYVPQGLGLLPHRSVAGNVRYPMELRTGGAEAKRVDELLARFGLSALATRRPGQLSSGEQQRVAIARALAARPSLLLWDEPLVALDLVGREDLLAALEDVQERERLPIVFVSHDPAIAFSLADQFLLLEAGRPVYRGPPEGMVARPPNGFAARFAGYENVFDTTTLAQLERTEFVHALAAARGPGGVCLRAPRIERGKDGEWMGRIRRTEPGPVGWSYVAELEGVRMRLRSDAGPVGRPGDWVRFSLDEAHPAPIGPAEEARA
jgi:ABC-type Fe3+/spermidine/putrescine transport system ATPase subunit